MLRTLLAKDLRRVRRNPVPWLIQLIVPVVITAIVGGFFGPRTNSQGLGQIHIAFVDEDHTWLTGMVHQTMGPEGRGISIKVDDLGREEARHLIDANKLAAVVIVPKGFTDDFIALRPVQFELIKNPANVLHPSVVEEYLATIATGMNALARTIGPEFNSWRQRIEADKDFDLLNTLLLLSDSATRLAPARDFVRPPLVGLTSETSAPQTGSAVKSASTESGVAGMFRFILIGMGAMFMLMIADNAGRDIYRELGGRTLARYRTLRTDLLGFLASKAVFAVAMVLIGAAILLGGGSLVFQFSWRHVPELCALVFGYAFFAAGLVTLIAGLAGSETRAAMFNNIIVMGLAIAGGCLFPLEDVTFWRTHVAPWMPTYWFAGTLRALEGGAENPPAWIGEVAKLAALGVLCLVAAAGLFRRRLEQGVRS